MRRGAKKKKQDREKERIMYKREKSAQINSRTADKFYAYNILLTYLSLLVIQFGSRFSKHSSVDDNKTQFLKKFARCT